MKTKLCLLAALSLSLLSLVSCQQVQARMEIREANDAYAKEDYATALKHYERARQIDPKSFPDLDRLIGYSLIGQYVPEDKSPANEQRADRASAELLTYLKKRPEDVAAREALINLYLNASRETDALNFFQNYLKTHPGDLATVRSVAQIYAKLGNFQESLNWYEKITLIDKNNPEAYYVFGVVCYENVAKNATVTPEQKVILIDKGKAALQHSIDMKPDYFESMAYLNLMLRQQALIETDPAKQQALIAQADQVRNRAVEIIKKKKADAAAAQAAAKKS